jgi:hypothetical protein
MNDSSRSLAAPVAIAMVFGALAGGGMLLVLRRPPADDAHPPPVVRPSPSVITAVRDLSRIEGASYHVERVIELTDTQEHLFGLVESEDVILLVAAADVVAGVDLSTLGEDAIQIDEARTHATITLPRATVFATVVDEEHTYVHARTTDMLAERSDALEGEARRQARDSLETAAVEGGLLDRADHSVARTVEALVRSLGIAEVEVRTAE